MSTPDSPAIESPGIPPAVLPWKMREWTLLLLLLVVTASLYFQTHRFDFIEYDDGTNIFQNTRVIHGMTPGTFRWALTATVTGNWFPVTVLSWISISSLFGMQPGAFHLFNVAIHAINVGLMFVFLRNATDRAWPTFFVAALWGLHPLRVESVAWVAETKDVLCGMFWLLCMLAYLRYSRRRSMWRYMVVAVLHGLALMSKSMAVTLPGTLLLLDYWPVSGSVPRSARWWRARVLEKLPLMVLSLADIAYAIRTQASEGAVAALSMFPMGVRIENAFVSLLAYLSETFFPKNLGLFYPHQALLPGGRVELFSVTAGVFLSIAIAIWALLNRKRHPYFIVGWLWFLGTLVPVIGIIQVGEQAHADRYTYIPAIGLTIALVWWISDLVKSSTAARYGATFVAIIAAIGLSIVTAVDAGYWKNTQTLAAHANAVIPNNYVAKSLLASTLFDTDRTDEMLELTSEAVVIAPNDDDVLVVRGLALMHAHKYEQAMAILVRAKNLNMRWASTWKAMGDVRTAQAEQCLAENKPGEMDFREKAIRDFQNAVFLDPNYPEPWDHLAEQTQRIGKLADAISIWQDLVNRSPEYASAQGHLADALRLTGDLHGAAQHYLAALKDGATNSTWETNLAYCVGTDQQATPDQVQYMIPIARHACDQTHDQSPAALDALAVCLARVGQFDAAITKAQQAIDLANRINQTTLASEIQHRLTRYRRGLPFLSGDN